jgi:protein TonB
LPEYPSALKAAGIGGEVTVAFIVDESGNVPHTAVLATTHPGFNDAAIQAVRRSKFKPAQRLGMNVRALLHAPLWFDPGTK